MALYRSVLDPSAIYRGNQQVSAVYRGNTEVWPADIRREAQIWMPLDPPARPLLEHRGTLSPTVSASTLQARDKYGYTASGAGAGASMPYAGTWNTGGTVSMWVRQTGQTSGAHAAFYRKSGTTEVAMWQQVASSQQWMLFSLIKNGIVVDLAASSVPVPNNEWVMVTLTVSRSAGSSSWTVRGYVNGQPAGSVTRNAGTQSIGPSDIAFAGTSWGGDLDDLLIWDRALSPAEVAQVHTSKVNSDSIINYPIQHTWDLNDHTLGSNTLLWSHTVTSAGSYTFTNTIIYGYVPVFGGTNPTARLVGPSQTVTGAHASTSTATATWNLSAGQTVEFRGVGNSSTVYRGEWSVIKN